MSSSAAPKHFITQEYKHSTPRKWKAEGFNPHLDVKNRKHLTDRQIIKASERLTLQRSPRAITQSLVCYSNWQYISHYLKGSHAIWWLKSLKQLLRPLWDSQSKERHKILQIIWKPANIYSWSICSGMMQEVYWEEGGKSIWLRNGPAYYFSSFKHQLRALHLRACIQCISYI